MVISLSRLRAQHSGDIADKSVLSHDDSINRDRYQLPMSHPIKIPRITHVKHVVPKESFGPKFHLFFLIKTHTCMLIIRIINALGDLSKLSTLTNELAVQTRDPQRKQLSIMVTTETQTRKNTRHSISNFYPKIFCGALALSFVRDFHNRR